MVFIVILNDVSFDAIVILNKNYEDVWFDKGFCELKLEKYKASLQKKISLSLSQ